MRRSHKKSRHGCKQCKQRHAKCDETRPVCINCTAANRRCSYLDSVAALPRPSASTTPSFHSGTTGSPALTTSSASPVSAAIGPDSSPVRSSNPGRVDVLLDERYGLLHLQLLHHFEHEVSKAMSLGQPDMEKMTQAIVREAFSAPFLMDELLAFSAAHRSSLADEVTERDFYLTEATRLQTRSLAQYNTTQAEVSEQNCLAIFLFSALLGQHMLFDTFSLQGELAALLDKLVQCLGIHRGIAAVAGGSWSTLQPQLRAHYGPYGAADHMERSGMSSPGTECSSLVTLLGRSDLSESSLQVCRGAVETLQHVFDVQRATQSHDRRIISVQEWLVRVPEGYINLLAQRRPEALVILAYYSVLLHRARDYWVVGDVGRFLIRSISDHLGAYWGDWLEWPNGVLSIEKDMTG